MAPFTFVHEALRGRSGRIVCTLLAVAAWSAAVAGCVSPPPPTGSFAIPAHGRAMVVVEFAPARSPRGLAALHSNDWDEVLATLSMAGPGARQWTATAQAFVAPGSGTRTARVQVAGVEPGEGYQLRLEFLKRPAGGEPYVIGAALRSGIGLVAGVNTISVAADVVWAATPPVQDFGQFDTYVTSFPGTGAPCRFNRATDVVAGDDGRYYYLDGNAIHCIEPDANGRLMSSTLVGSQVARRGGLRDGAGDQALFLGPRKIVMGPGGSLIVADTGNHAIRQVLIQPDGRAVVRTLAGTGLAGSDDGDGRTARFNSPAGLAVTPDGAIYVADTQNHRIRKLLLDDGGATTVSTVAGSGTSGFADGLAAEAQFNAPVALVTLPDGDLVVGDTLAPRVRRISWDGDGNAVVTSLAGTGQLGAARDGPAATAIFGRIEAIVAEPGGDVLVGDGRVRRIAMGDPEEPTVTTIAGAGTAFSADVTAADAGFQGGTLGLSRNAAGDIYVVTPRMIRRLALDGGGVLRATRFAGFAEDGDDATFDGPLDGWIFQPESIAVHASGDIFVATTNSQILRLRAPSFGSQPEVVAGDGMRGHRDGPAQSARFNSVKGMALDEAGNLYVADFSNHCIRRITELSGGQPLVETVAGVVGSAGSVDGPAGSATFANPIDMTFAADGSLYIADVGRKLIRRLERPGDSTAAVTTVAGMAQLGPGGLHADGQAQAALFRSPIGLDFSLDGSLFVADGDSIRKVSPPSGQPVIVTSLGNSGEAVDGALVNAAFSSVSDVLIDRDGTIFVADGPRIRMIKFDAESQGFVSSIVGSTYGFSDGPGATAQGSAFVDLAWGPDREIYAVDYFNRLIRRIVRRK